MGGARKFVPSPELKTKIIELYASGKSVDSTCFVLREQGNLLTESSVKVVLIDAGIMRNARQLKGARVLPVYNRVKKCEHCKNEFKQLFNRHIFCDECAPEGKFSKYIRKYGVGMREFKLMLKIQRGVCAICEKQLDLGKDTHVDHDHTTGRVRGLLCNFCNSRVGILDDTNFVSKARAYTDLCIDYRTSVIVNDNESKT
jgi:hypothetical protein